MPASAQQQVPASSATSAPVSSVPTSSTSGAQARFGNSFLAEQLAGRSAGSPPGTTPGTEATTNTTPGAAPGTAPTTTPGTATSTQAAPATSPLKISHPLPVVPGEQRRTVLGVQILGTAVSPSALDACEAFVRMTIGTRPDIQERLQAASVALVILPRNQKMTDVPQFAGLRGTRTFDGRLWDDVRGSGGMRVAGGLWAIGVPEENLVQVDGVTDGYGAGYSVGLHEFAHTVHSKGVSAAERATITTLYEARRRANGPWTEGYGASNEQEYFAQSTNCFFSENAGIGQNGPEWLRTNDRPMYDFLVTLYGPPTARAQASA